MTIANDNQTAKNPKIRQTGLYSRSREEIEEFADRVSEYNKSKGFIVVEMEATESPPDNENNFDHWKIILEFKSRSYARDFWTDPKYQRRIKPVRH